MAVNPIGPPGPGPVTPRARDGGPTATEPEPRIADTFTPEVSPHPAFEGTAGPADAESMPNDVERLISAPSGAELSANVSVIAGRLSTLLLSPASVLERAQVLREVLAALSRRDVKAALAVERTLRGWLEANPVLPVEAVDRLFGELHPPAEPTRPPHAGPGSMKTRAVMTREVLWVAPQAPLRDVHALMRQRRIRHVPVIADGLLAGVLSDRDVLTHARVGADGELIVPVWPAARAMTPDPMVCSPESTVGSAARTMLEQKIDCLPVVTLGRTVIGIVTSADLLELLCEPGRRDTALPYDFVLLQGVAA